jgi:hypothetical protein
MPPRPLDRDEELARDEPSPPPPLAPEGEPAREEPPLAAEGEPPREEPPLAPEGELRRAELLPREPWPPPRELRDAVCLDAAELERRESRFAFAFAVDFAFDFVLVLAFALAGFAPPRDAVPPLPDFLSAIVNHHLVRTRLAAGARQ